MFEPLLKADPSFLPKWKAFLAHWEDEPEPPLYLALSDLAVHLLSRIANGETHGLQEVFQVVEQWHLEGDHYVAEAATVGLLESIQNQIGGNDSKDGERAAAVEKWLSPETRRWWDKLYQFWDGDPAALR